MQMMVRRMRIAVTGTHVAGSVLGDGASSVVAGHKVVRGLAYESELVFEVIEQWANWFDECIA
jgi:hypothetical protein